jgi:BirA family transcriptional regulator, biotin operon repressor / biotin---[acetyl-CoA-carboxylase] ligase
VTHDASPAALWQGRSVARWLEQWRIPELRVYDRVGSTNDVARERAAGGAHAGTVVLAELQTAGRGRFGRRWEAAPGAALLLSCLLRPRNAGDAVPGTTPLRVGIAVAAAIESVTGTRVSLKWPNDIVLSGAGKVGGILCEAVTTGDKWCVVVGIGINVRQDAWPRELDGSATSLDVASGVATDRARLAGALIDRLRPLFTAPLAPLDDAELDAFRSRDALAGKLVIADEEGASKGGSMGGTAAGRRHCGTGDGIAPDGALLLRTDRGTVRITTGTVRIVHEPGERSTMTAYP